MAEPKESPSNNPGLQATPDEATKDYFMQQTMLRIKDPTASLDFYSRILGMSLLKRLDSPQMKFSIYFMGYEDTTSAPSDPVDRTVWTLSKRATIELTHYWGTESDPEFKGYHNGNTDPRGFVISALQKAISAQHNSTVVAVTPLECENQTIWHIGITVDDTCKACERFEKLGVEFVMKPGEGKMKGLAFIKDPDGYWIEIFDLTTIRDVCAGAA